MVYPIARRSFMPLVRFFAKTIEGIENIPTTEPLVVAANHLGLFDPAFIGSVYVRRTKKKLRFLVDTRNLFWKTIGITLNYWTNSIPIRPGRRTEAFTAGIAALRAGDSIGMFPEGRVNTSPTLLEGRSGAVRMSLVSGCRIIPVGIENTDVRLLTIIGRRLANHQEGITMRFGQPYLPSGDPDNERDVRVATDDLMRRIADLCRKTYPV